MSSSGADPNKVYTISMSTIIKMECEDCEKAKYLEKGNQTFNQDQMNFITAYIRINICQFQDH